MYVGNNTGAFRTKTTNILNAFFAMAIHGNSTLVFSSLAAKFMSPRPKSGTMTNHFFLWGSFRIMSYASSYKSLLFFPTFTGIFDTLCIWDIIIKKWYY